MTNTNNTNNVNVNTSSPLRRTNCLPTVRKVRHSTSILLQLIKDLSKGPLRVFSLLTACWPHQCLFANMVDLSKSEVYSCAVYKQVLIAAGPLSGLVNQTYFFPFIFGRGKKVWCNSVALFVLPDPQILEMLIGVDGVERPANEARVTLNRLSVNDEVNDDTRVHEQHSRPVSSAPARV